MQDFLESARPRAPEGNHRLFERFWLRCGVPVAELEAQDGTSRFVRTPGMTRHLRNLARAILIG